VQVVYKRESRKINALKFRFKPIKKLNPLKHQDKIINNQALLQRLKNEFGLTEIQAINTIKRYPIPYIKETLEIIKLKINQKKVKKIPAYTLTVLKNDYVPITQQTQQKKE
jgi:hypothetical protein